MEIASTVSSKRTGRVLVVDDDPITQELCAFALRQQGFAVELLAVAEPAFELLQRSSFDLVLLDLVIPDLDGLSLLERLRAKNINIPTLIITGTATVEDAARAMRLGADGLLTKPFSPELLLDTVSGVLQKRRAMQVQDRIKALRPVVRISQTLLAELDLHRLQDLIIATVRSELDADRAVLMLLDDDQQTLRIAALSGLPPEVRVGQRVSPQRSLAGWVARNRQPAAVNERGEVAPPEANPPGPGKDEPGARLIVPVLAGERVLGVLNAAKIYGGRPFSAADAELLILLAGQAAIAIENARLYHSIAASETRYRTLLQHATDAVVLIDAAGQVILDHNLALERLSGFSRAQLRAMIPQQLLPQLDDWQQFCTVAQGNGVANTEAPEIETVLQTAWEQTTPVAISVSSVPFDGQRLLLVIARDISARQRLARQLFQTEKLAALGRLAASMAHEINNPLQAIRNSVHLMLNRDLDDEKLWRYMELTQEEIDRLISIVQRMLDFSRPSSPEGMRPTDLNELLQSVLTMVGNQLEAQDVRLVCELYEPLPCVYAISSHIKQVCLSLIFNALEAMPEGGALRVRSYVLEGEEAAEEIKAEGDRAGQRVVLEFADNGPGITAHDLPKIFEPFFTTRIKGPGLGLAISYIMIEQHHGQIAVESELGQGATFRIVLPAA